MKNGRLFALLTAVVCLLSSCEGFEIGFNRDSRVYERPYPLEYEYYDSFSYYVNADYPIRWYGGRLWYYFWEGYAASPKGLATIDDETGVAYVVCTDPECCHNKVDYTYRCEFCDLTDYSDLAVSDGFMYFVREDTSYYNERTGKIMYMKNTEYEDEAEFPESILSYSFSDGVFNTLYEVPAGSYIEKLKVYGEYLYFFETSYVEEPEYVFTDMDINWHYFSNLEDGSVLTIPSERFYTREYLDMYADYYDTRYERITDIKHNRTSKVENGTLWQKRISLKRLNIGTGALEDLTENGISAVPEEFFIFADNIYILTDTALLGYGMTFEESSEHIIFTRESGVSYSDFQYDEYTANIYFLAERTDENGTSVNSLCKVKGYGQAYRLVRYTDITAGFILSYQLTLDGIYYTVSGGYEGCVLLSGYLDINYPDVPFTVVYAPDERLPAIKNPTVSGNYIYAELAEYKKTGSGDALYSLIRISLDTMNTDMIWPSNWELS